MINYEHDRDKPIDLCAIIAKDYTVFKSKKEALLNINHPDPFVKRFAKHIINDTIMDIVTESTSTDGQLVWTIQDDSYIVPSKP